MKTPTQQYLEDLVKMVEDLETQFRTLNSVIVKLQEERDYFKDLYEEVYQMWRKLVTEQSRD